MHVADGGDIAGQQDGGRPVMGDQRVELLGHLGGVSRPGILGPALHPPLRGLPAGHLVHHVVGALHMDVVGVGAEQVDHGDIGAGAVHLGEQVGNRALQRPEGRQQVRRRAVQDLVPDRALAAGPGRGRCHPDRRPPAGRAARTRPVGTSRVSPMAISELLRHALVRCRSAQLLPTQLDLSGSGFVGPGDIDTDRDERPTPV